MKYRHSFHAGNFADVHKHVALLALVSTLEQKEKGFRYLETHAGRGAYDLGNAAENAESRTGIDRLGDDVSSEELTRYLGVVRAFRARQRNPRAYPGSPLIVAQALRPQDRAVLIERVATEAQALERAVAEYPRVRVECADGFERLRAYLPPAERRGLVLIDPPYEESRRDGERAADAIVEALRRFPTGVIVVWYPIKHARDSESWLAALAPRISREALVSELWLYPRDSRAALNGSGLLIVNPPYRTDERMREWLPQLCRHLDTRGTGGTSVRPLISAAGKKAPGRG